MTTQNEHKASFEYTINELSRTASAYARHIGTSEGKWGPELSKVLKEAANKCQGAAAEVGRAGWKALRDAVILGHMTGRVGAKEAKRLTGLKEYQKGKNAPEYRTQDEQAIVAASKMFFSRTLRFEGIKNPHGNASGSKTGKPSKTTQKKADTEKATRAATERQFIAQIAAGSVDPARLVPAVKTREAAMAEAMFLVRQFEVHARKNAKYLPGPMKTAIAEFQTALTKLQNEDGDVTPAKTV